MANMHSIRSLGSTLLGIATVLWITAGFALAQGHTCASKATEALQRDCYAEELRKVEHKLGTLETQARAASGLQGKLEAAESEMSVLRAKIGVGQAELEDAKKALAAEQALFDAHVQEIAPILLPFLKDKLGWLKKSSTAQPSCPETENVPTEKAAVFLPCLLEATEDFNPDSLQALENLQALAQARLGKRGKPNTKVFEKLSSLKKLMTRLKVLSPELEAGGWFSVPASETAGN